MIIPGHLPTSVFYFVASGCRDPKEGDKDCHRRLRVSGPEGGAAGGRIVAQGTPEVVARSRESFTGRFLAEILHDVADLERHLQGDGIALFRIVEGQPADSVLDRGQNLIGHEISPGASLHMMAEESGKFLSR